MKIQRDTNVSGSRFGTYGESIQEAGSHLFDHRAENQASSEVHGNNRVLESVPTYSLGVVRLKKK